MEEDYKYNSFQNIASSSQYDNEEGNGFDNRIKLDRVSLQDDLTQITKFLFMKIFETTLDEGKLSKYTIYYIFNSIVFFIV